MERKLFMVLLGSKPIGRHLEQHDIYFGIGATLKELLPGILSSWPEANGKIHIDAWREVTRVDGFKITVVEKGKSQEMSIDKSHQLYFINLGGYKPGEFEEFHYKMVVAAKDKGEAIHLSKASAFYKHTGFEGAISHIDDKYGVDVDDIEQLEDILDAELKRKFSIQLERSEGGEEDDWHLGYLNLNLLEST